MRAFYSDHFVLPLPEGHKFPMAKYSRLRERILAEGIVAPGDLHEAPAASWDDLRLVHDAAYVDAVANGTVAADIQRRIGFPWSPAMVERSRRSVGATIAAARAALDDGVSANLAGGTHHAFADRGEGFCVFNDVAVAARVLQRDHHASRIAVVDLDVHQGNGTACDLRGDDPSFHVLDARREELSVQEGSQRPRRGARRTAPATMTTSRRCDCTSTTVLNRHQPDFVFYLAGADPFEGDRLGRLKLTD